MSSDTQPPQKRLSFANGKHNSQLLTLRRVTIIGQALRISPSPRRQESPNPHRRHISHRAPQHPKSKEFWKGPAPHGTAPSVARSLAASDGARSGVAQGPIQQHQNHRRFLATQTQFPKIPRQSLWIVRRRLVEMFVMMKSSGEISMRCPGVAEPSS